MKIIKFSEYKLNENFYSFEESSKLKKKFNISDKYTVNLKYDTDVLLENFSNYCSKMRIKPTVESINYILAEYTDDILEPINDFEPNIFFERNDYENFDDYFDYVIENYFEDEWEQILKTRKTNDFNL